MFFRWRALRRANISFEKQLEIKGHTSDDAAIRNTVKAQQRIVIYTKLICIILEEVNRLNTNIDIVINIVIDTAV